MANNQDTSHVVVICYPVGFYFLSRFFLMAKLHVIDSGCLSVLLSVQSMQQC